MKKWLCGVMSLALAGSLAVPAGTSAEPSVQPVRVQLLGINDFHGQLDTVAEVKDSSGQVVDQRGGAEYLASYLKTRKQENPNTLLVHAGDAVGASAPLSALSQDEPTLTFLKGLGFSVGTLGNHEFDHGVAELKRQVYGGVNPATGQVWEGTAPDLSYVIANVVDEKTGETLFPSYTIKETGGVKIGFTGVVTMETPNIVNPSGIKGYKFIDQAESVNKAVAEMKKQGVQTIVVLAHDPGFGKTEQDANGEVVELAKKLDDEVDVIFAGHNHGLLNVNVNGKLIVQAYSYGTAFSDVDLEIDPATGQVMAKRAEVVSTNHKGVTPDAETVRFLEQLKAGTPKLYESVGTSGEAITRTASPTGESALGNLIADGMRAAMKTDFAFMNSGGIRNDLPAGKVTYGDLFKVQPFGNVLIKMTLTGAQFRELLNQQWKGQDPGRPRIGQISGFTYRWDDSKPDGEKVLDIRKEDGTPVTDEASYTITVNDFMANGGDKYVLLKEGAERTAGPLDLDATLQYIQDRYTSQGKPLAASIEGRITRVPSQPASVFEDVLPGFWAYDAIAALAERRIISGVSSTRFEPERKVTRAEITALLVRALGLKETAGLPFTDVPASYGLAPELSAAFQAGLIDGVSASQFAPDRPVRREEIAALAVRAHQIKTGQKAEEAGDASFPDGKEVSAWAKPYVNEAARLGLMEGRAEGIFAPQAPATRAESAKLVHTLIR